MRRIGKVLYIFDALSTRIGRSQGCLLPDICIYVCVYIYICDHTCYSVTIILYESHVWWNPHVSWSSPSLNAVSRPLLRPECGVPQIRRGRFSPLYGDQTMKKWDLTMKKLDLTWFKHEQLGFDHKHLACMEVYWTLNKICKKCEYDQST